MDWLTARAHLDASMAEIHTDNNQMANNAVLINYIQHLQTLTDQELALFAYACELRDYCIPDADQLGAQVAERQHGDQAALHKLSIKCASQFPNVDAVSREMTRRFLRSVLLP